MRISQKKRQQLYNAIYDSIMDTRIILQKDKSYFGDYEIAQTVGKIWDKQKAILGLEKKPSKNPKALSRSLE
jgi:hypothetical protein